MVANETELSTQLADFPANNKASLTLELVTGRLSRSSTAKWKAMLEWMNESFELERINFFVTSVGEEGGEGGEGGKNAREKTRFDSKGFSLDETNARICYDSFSFSIKGGKKKKYLLLII